MLWIVTYNQRWTLCTAVASVIMWRSTGVLCLLYNVYWWVVCDKLIQLASCCVNDSINDQQVAAVASGYKSWQIDTSIHINPSHCQSTIQKYTSINISNTINTHSFISDMFSCYLFHCQISHLHLMVLYRAGPTLSHHFWSRKYRYVFVRATVRVDVQSSLN